MPKALQLSEEELLEIFENRPLEGRLNADDLAKKYKVVRDIIHAAWFCGGAGIDSDGFEEINNHRLSAGRKTAAEMADEYGIGKQTIVTIWRRYREDEGKRELAAFLKSELSDKDVEKLEKFFAKKMSVNDIAKKLGALKNVVEGHIRRLRRGDAAST